MQKNADHTESEATGKALTPAALLTLSLMPERGYIAYKDLVTRMGRDSGTSLIFVKNVLAYVNGHEGPIESIKIDTETMRPVVLELLRKDFVGITSMSDDSLLLGLKRKGGTLVSMVRKLVMSSSDDPTYVLQSFREQMWAYRAADNMIADNSMTSNILKMG